MTRTPKERDPDSWIARMSRWYKIHYRGHKVLLTFQADPDHDGEVLLTEELVKASDVPHEAVRVVDMPNTMILDRIKVRYAPHDENFSARHVALYMESNKVTDAIAHSWMTKAPFDKRILLVIGVGAAFVLYYLYAVVL